MWSASSARGSPLYEEDTDEFKPSSSQNTSPPVNRITHGYPFSNIWPHLRTKAFNNSFCNIVLYLSGTYCISQQFFCSQVTGSAIIRSEKRCSKRSCSVSLFYFSLSVLYLSSFFLKNSLLFSSEFRNGYFRKKRKLFLLFTYIFQLFDRCHDTFY